MMIRVASLALTCAIAVFGVSSGTAAAANNAPWCAVISTTDDSVYWDCQYRSFEECRPHVLAGNRGWCNPSPYYVPGSAEQSRSTKRRVRPY
jgi:hypothetical protein